MSPITQYNERECLLLAAEGNEQAFSQIFLRFSDKLYNYALKITKSKEIAEDIVHDTFLKIWTNRTELRTVQHIEAFLFVVVKNRAFNCLKQIAERSRHISYLQYSSVEFNNPTEEQMLQKEYNHILLDKINRLPPQQKLIYHLSKNEGLRNVEIAKYLNLSNNTVKSHLVKALRALRSSFEALMCLLLWWY